MNKKIVIVDDDLDLCEELQEILIDEGFQVDVISSGSQALEFIKNKDFDLLILDLKLPDVDGIELLKKAKEKDFKNKVMIMSAKSVIKSIEEDMDDFDKEYKQEVSKLADGFISKPFDIEKFVKTVRNIIGIYGIEKVK